MAKKKNKQPELPVEEAPVEEKKQQPVASPAKVVQLTPIIQPIAFVPYSTQEQELYMYDEEVEEEEDYGEEEEEIVEAPKKKRVSAAAIFLSIFSLLIIAVFVAGKYVLQDYLAVLGSTSGLDVTMNMIDAQDFTDITALLITIVPVAAVIVLLSSLIRIMHKGACVVAMIFSLIGIGCALAAILLILLDGSEEPGYGLYAMAVLSLISMLIAFLSKREEKVKKAKK